jgi:excisionase family DNA binding protein
MAIGVEKQTIFKNERQRFRLPEQEHVEVQDIANYCMVSTTTVRRWLKSNKLSSFKLPSNQFRVRVEDFKAFLKRYNIPLDKKYMD